MGDEKEMMHRHKGSVEMEGVTQCPQWSATTWHQLLGGICSCGHMANAPVLLDLGTS